jgi:hypothetical protein
MVDKNQNLEMISFDSCEINKGDINYLLTSKEPNI